MRFKGLRKAERMLKRGEMAKDIFNFFTQQKHDQIIQDIKNKQKFTNEDLAEYLNCTQPTISRMYHGKIPINPKHWYKLYNLIKKEWTWLTHAKQIAEKAKMLECLKKEAMDSEEEDKSLFDTLDKIERNMRQHTFVLLLGITGIIITLLLRL